MKIYTIRHGETDWNKLNRVQGTTDNPLNEKGLQQAEETGENLKDIPFTKVYSSPLIRARQTTEGVLKKLNCKPEVHLSDAIVEQNFGIWEGVPRDDPEYQKEKAMYFKRFEGGESILDVAARIYPFLEKIIRESNEDDIILISGHGGVSRMVAGYFKAYNNQDFMSYFAKNCEAQVYEVSEELRQQLIEKQKKCALPEETPFSV